MKILAVDDDPFILELLTEVVAMFEDHELLTAASAADALRVMGATTDIDCFLVDIQMPGQDGISLCRAIRKIEVFERSPILMLTAMSEKRYIDDAFAAGATDYINKPFEIQDLRSRLNTVEKLIASRRADMDRLFVTPSGHRASERDTPIALYEPFDIHDIDGVVAPMALENYVTKLSRNALFGSSVFGVAVRQIDGHYGGLSSFDFQSMIVDVAEALSDQLASHQFLLTYVGSGCFICVVEGGARLDVRRFTDAVNLAVHRMGLSSSAGEPLVVRVAVGAIFRLFWRPGQHALDALSQAHTSAEQEADRVERELDQIWFMEQSA